MSQTVFTITVRATSISIVPGEESVQYLQPLLNLMEYEDEYTEEFKTLGYVLDKETDIMYLHKGVDLDYLKRLIPHSTFKQNLFDDYEEMEFEYEEIVSPRNEDQVDVINFISGQKSHSNNIDQSQLFLVKAPGFGKTYCSGVGLCMYGVKSLIIIHRDQLRKQWVDSLFHMSGLSNRYVHEISTSEELYQIAHNQHDFDYDVYLMTHATFRAGLKRIGNFKDAMNIGKNLKIGMKIIDEAHLEFRDTLIMDIIFNVKRNLYLTATDGRSSREENAIFRHAFSKALFYRKTTVDPNIPSKWVDYYRVEINSQCKPNIYRYRVNGGRGMNPASYGKWVIQYDKKKTHFKCCKDILENMFTEDEYAKVLIFMPLIDLCEELVYFLNTELKTEGKPPIIKSINSHNSKYENEKNKKADIIVTTVGSCGTGTDIPGVTGIISCSPFCSQVTAKQIFGRIRWNGKRGQYYDIVDSSVQMDKYWNKSRMKVFKNIALNVRYLNWHDENE